MSMKDNIIPHIHGCKASNETWTTVKDLYETKNKNQVLSLTSNVISINMESNNTITNFILGINDLKDKLGDRKINI